MRAYNPQDKRPTYAPALLVATVGSKQDARRASTDYFRQWAEDQPEFRDMRSMMQGNRGTL